MAERSKKRKPKRERPPGTLTIGPYTVRKRSSTTGKMMGYYDKDRVSSRKGSVVTGRKTVHVVSRKDGWTIKVGGKALSIHDTKAKAVDHGKDIAKSARLGHVVIHKQDGSIQTVHTYSKDTEKEPA